MSACDAYLVQLCLHVMSWTHQPSCGLVVCSDAFWRSYATRVIIFSTCLLTAPIPSGHAPMSLLMRSACVDTKELPPKASGLLTLSTHELHATQCTFNERRQAFPFRASLIFSCSGRAAYVRTLDSAWDLLAVLLQSADGDHARGIEECEKHNTAWE